MIRGAVVAALVAAFACAAPASVQAFDAATTHAGLTERAVNASTLRRRLGALYAWGARRPSGLYETLVLQGGGGGDGRIEALLARLSRLDPAGGVRPDGGRLTALGWLVAGSVLEEVPASRAQNHFIDSSGGPTSERGLDTASAFGRLEIRLSQPDGFVGTGVASTRWLVSPDNDLSLTRFLDARERSLVAATPAARDVAAAESLLAAGALLHVIEDAAEPAYVHNDLVVDLFAGHAPFTRYVAARYGRFAVPEPTVPARTLLHLADAIHNADHTGLADRTAVRFFSLGVLAAGVGGDPRGAVAPPAMPRLEAGTASEGYVEDAGHHRLARWRRDVGGTPGVRWDLDAHCYQDAAAVLLPEAGGAALSALEHLFRGGLVVQGGAVQNGEVALGAGKLHVLLEEESGARRELVATDVAHADARATLGTLPPEAEGKRVVVAFRGLDASGEPIVVAGERGK